MCGWGGENGGEAIAPEADDIAGERGEIAEQGVEAMHRKQFAPAFARAGVAGSVRLRLALRCAAGEGLAFATTEVRCAARAAGSGSSNSIGARLCRMCHCR